MKCPTVKEIIETNRRVLGFNKRTKAERHEVLASKKAIQNVLDKSCKGKDIYKNAAVMLKELNQLHAFGSANKRTSFVAATNYLKQNNKEIPERTRDEQAKFMLKVRENKKSIGEIKRWLKS